MTDYFITGANARWQVLWVSTKGGKKRIIEQDFEHDLMAAVALYTKAKAAGKPFATLRCCNVGFPPPEKYLTRVVRRKEKVVRGGRTRTVVKEYDFNPMALMNQRGVMWCPFCMQMRHPQYQGGVRVDGILVPVEGYHCPICGISHRNGHVRRWNPLMPEPTKRTRRSPVKTSARRRPRKSR